MNFMIMFFQRLTLTTTILLLSIKSESQMVKVNSKAENAFYVSTYTGKEDSLFRYSVHRIAGKDLIEMEIFSKYPSKAQDNKKLPLIDGYYIDSIPYGFIAHIKFPNLNLISVNSGSVIKYHPEKKTVILSGEAAINTNKDSLIVQINDSTRILCYPGSLINISAYHDFQGINPNGPFLKIVQVDGNIKIYINRTCHLSTKRNYQFSFTKAGEIQSEGESEYIEDELNWIYCKFDNRNIQSRELLKRLCRWYFKDLVYPVSLFNSTLRFASKFKQPLSYVLAKINLISGSINCHIDGGHIIVTDLQHSY